MPGKIKLAVISALLAICVTTFVVGRKYISATEPVRGSCYVTYTCHNSTLLEDPVKSRCWQLFQRMPQRSEPLGIWTSYEEAVEMASVWFNCKVE